MKKQTGAEVETEPVHKMPKSLPETWEYLEPDIYILAWLCHQM